MEIELRNFIIRQLDTSESDKVFDLINNNRTRLENYFAGTVKETKTKVDTIIFCQNVEVRRANKEYYPFVIIDPSTSKYIGWIDVKNIDWRIPKAELGYFIDESYTGQGLISEGLALVIEYINKEFDFKKLLLRIGSDNPKSAKIARFNNFELEGNIRRDYKTSSGNLVDLQYFGKLF